MAVSMGRRRFAAIALASVAVLATGTACGDDSGGTDADGNITLTIDLFGEQGFGYDALIEQYMKDNPKVKVEQRGKGLGVGDYNQKLTQWIGSGTGAGDIVALEEGIIAQFKANKDAFVDLTDHGAADVKGNFLPWKWEAGTTADGTVLGYGTDIGSMAICYRKDLFEAAKLPTDREEVGALWPTWDAYIQTGQRFAAANTDAKFVDAATNLYNTMLTQAAGAGTGYTYFDKSDKLVLAENPDIKTAWDLTTRMIAADLSAGLNAFTDQWNTGFKQAQFATIACPAWMTGVIQGNAGEGAAGKWDIAKVPGESGNWGGSYLAVPKQSKNQAEAAKLAKYLTTPEAHVQAFTEGGFLPSTLAALEDTKVLELTNEYFSGAPTGQIFAAGAKDLKPVYLGPKNQAVRDAVENALRSIEQKARTADQAWADAQQSAEAAAK